MILFDFEYLKNVDFYEDRIQQNTVFIHFKMDFFIDFFRNYWIWMKISGKLISLYLRDSSYFLRVFLNTTLTSHHSVKRSIRAFSYNIVWRYYEFLLNFFFFIIVIFFLSCCLFCKKVIV